MLWLCTQFTIVRFDQADIYKIDYESRKKKFVLKTKLFCPTTESKSIKKMIPFEQSLCKP